MKKILVLLLALVLCFAAVGCIEEDNPTKEQNGNQASDGTNADSFALNETAVFKNLKFTATEIEESNGDEYFEPDDGNVFVGVKFVIENTSDETESISSLMQFEGYVGDIACDYSISAACVFDEGTLDGDIAPGKKMVGWYSIEVPKNWSEIEIHVQADILSDGRAKFIFTK